MRCPRRLDNPSRRAVGRTRGRRTVWSGTLRCGDRGSQPPAGSVQADPRRVARATKHRRDLPGAQPLPGLQRQDLPIAVSQRPKRGGELRQLTRRGFGRVPAGQIAAQALGELSAATLAATMVCQHPTRDAVQPQDARSRQSAHRRADAKRRGMFRQSRRQRHRCCRCASGRSPTHKPGARRTAPQSAARRASTVRSGRWASSAHVTLHVHQSNKHFSPSRNRG